MQRRSKESRPNRLDTSAKFGKRTDPPDAPPLFEKLVSLAEDQHRERIRVSEVFGAMHEEAVVALVLLFALPNVVPMPPGTSAVVGAPLLFLTTEWLLGTQPWLPRLLARRSMARTTFASMMHQASRLQRRFDRLLIPRFQTFAGPLARRLVAGLCVVLATIILLPIPFGNMPPAWAISIITLGMLRRDGLWILLGISTGLASIALVWGVAISIGSSTVESLQRLLG
jgi:hypothetical protein